MFRLMRGDSELGCSPLEGLDDGMAVATGNFVPSAGYGDVASLFRRISDAIEARSIPPELWTERDALTLRLLGPDGDQIPVDWIMVYDYGDELDRELHVKLASMTAWKKVHDPRSAG